MNACRGITFSQNQARNTMEDLRKSLLWETGDWHCCCPALSIMIALCTY